MIKLTQGYCTVLLEPIDKWQSEVQKSSFPVYYYGILHISLFFYEVLPFKEILRRQIDSKK